MITLKFKIGKAVIEVSGKNEKELIEDASIFYELPCQCGLCKSANLGFRHRLAKEYDFYEMLCLDCRGTYAFGQKKEGGGLFPKGNDNGEWEPKYEGKSNSRDDDRRDSRRDDRRSDDRRPAREDDRRDSRRDDKPRDTRREEAPRGRPAGDDTDDIPF